MKQKEHEPRIFTTTKTVGHLELKFEGEQYIGHPIIDTRVTINGHELCWITWDNVDAFTRQLYVVIEKYSI